MNNNRKNKFSAIFAVGLILCLISKSLFQHYPINEVNSLVFSAIIAVFGGVGLLIEIFRK